MQEPRDRAWIAYLMLTIAAVTWGGNIVVGRAVHEDIPPIGLNFWRWIGALAVLLPFTLGDLARNWGVVRREWKYLVLLAGTGLALVHSLLYHALNSTLAINAALVMALVPIAIPVYSRIIWGDRLTGRQALGIAVSLAGVAVLITRGDLTVLVELAFAEGDLWMIGAMLCWSLYSVLVKRQPKELHPNTLLTALVLFAVVMILPFYLWESAVGRTVPLTMQTAWAVGYVALFASVLAMLLFNRAVAMIGPNRAGPFAHVVPISGVAIAVTLLGERLEPYHVLGLVLIATGIAIATVRTRVRGGDLSRLGR